MLWPTFLAHAFGQRYELPIPLGLFLLASGGVVFITFLLVARQTVRPRAADMSEVAFHRKPHWALALISFVTLTLFVMAGFFGSQTVAENIVPTLFWLVVWIAVPLSCGLLGNWTRSLNPFAHIATYCDSRVLRRLTIGQVGALKWPFGYWPSVALFFILACGELIFNQTATLPSCIASALLIYFVVSGLGGLLFGDAWVRQGEVFSVLFATWGRLGYFRFGAPGLRGFVGGLAAPFEPAPGHVVFVLLLLVSVSFDGLLATPFWARAQAQLPSALGPGTLAGQLARTFLFALLAIAVWALFRFFAWAVQRVAGAGRRQTTETLMSLLPSLMPISFAYLLAHNLQYLIVNGQLLLPLIGNPVGSSQWPIQLGFPFNDSFEPNPQVLPAAFYWYATVAVIVAAHVIAVVLAHHELGGQAQQQSRPRRQAEYPWLVAMVAYTMFSLWLLAQPLVKEQPSASAVREDRAAYRLEVYDG